MKRMLLFFVFISLTLFFLFPAIYIDAFSNGLAIFVASVVPTLFPFMFACKIIVNSGGLPIVRKVPLYKMLKAPPYVNEIFVLSLLCGYPLGAKMCAEYYDAGLIDETGAQKIATICSAPSPIFCVATVGAVYLNNVLYGYILLISNVMSTIICGIVYQNQFISKKNEDKFIINPTNENLLFDGMQSALKSIAIVGGFFTCFFVFTSMLQDLLLNVFPYANPVVISVILGCVEMTKGCLLITNCAPLSVALPTCCFLTSFGGICVFAQTLIYYKKCRLKSGKILLYRLFQGLTSAAVCASMTLPHM